MKVVRVAKKRENISRKVVAECHHCHHEIEIDETNIIYGLTGDYVICTSCNSLIYRSQWRKI